MSLNDKFASVQMALYNKVEELFEKIAVQFGYPDNPGLPRIPNALHVMRGSNQPMGYTLPKRITYFPPPQEPQTWFEVIFGQAPKVEPLPRYIYETQDEGFYNFYIENYRNLFFLPNKLSQFIQLKLNICLDISALEIFREVLFVAIVIYCQIITIRIAISWFIFINPYTFPWYFVISAVDWTEDSLQGIIPSIFGVNITASIFLGALGALADCLNHLVFTMPFLPGEGEATQLVINNQLKDVLVFHYLPVLWYKYPIPNDIREFWFYQRPDILEYMKLAYGDLNLQLLPDSRIFF